MSTPDSDDSAPRPTATASAVAELLPEGWRQRRGPAHASAYVMPGASLAELSPAFAVDLGDVCAVMGWLGLPRLAIEGTFQHRPEGGVVIASTRPEAFA